MWRNGPFSHLARLEVPRAAVPHGFRFSATGRRFGGLLSATVLCGSLLGVSGNHRDEDPVVADLIMSGQLRFTGAGASYALGPGQICIRDTKASWKFECASATRFRMIAIPRSAMLTRMSSPTAFKPAHVSDVSSSEIRLFLNFVEAIERSSEELARSTAAQGLALDACASLFAGLLAKSSASTLDDHQEALTAGARNVVENNLDDPDLSPKMIAQLLGVSLRTLHRHFAKTDESIMTFARRRRLEKACEQLMRAAGPTAISDVAARWHFSDASHFTRTFKSFYGTTPAAYVRNKGDGPQGRRDGSEGCRRGDDTGQGDQRGR
jgi:AraC family transcriptional activator of tynA and feaB